MKNNRTLKIKKILICFFSLILICVFISSCNNKTNSKVETQPKNIELTVENVEEYLNISASFENSYHENLLGLAEVSYSTVRIETYSIRSGSFDNVKIVVESKLPKGTVYEFKVDTEDVAYNESNPNLLSVDIRLPSDGRFNSTHDISCFYYAGTLNGVCELKIVSVSGTFMPSA